jgi:ATP-dependent helicase/nuclease subunit B
VRRAEADPLAASVSRLESFARCPFTHYADYWLKLEPRVEAELDAAEVGTVCHLILERFISDLVAGGRGLAELEDDEIAERIDRAAEAARPLIGGAMMLEEARNAFLVDRGRSYMNRVSRWQRDAARLGSFQPWAVEFPFGFAGGRCGPLTLRTPKGRTVHLRGRIDRVDLAKLGGELVGLVVDYKTTARRTLDLTEVLHGLSLQLVAYLLVLEQQGESLTGRPIRPVAALYLPLLEPFQTVPHPEEEKKSNYRYRGIVDLQGLSALDTTVEPGRRSQILSAAITNQGQPHKRCDLATPEQVAAVLRHVGRRMGELADELIDGRIDVSPYRLNRRMPCTFCRFRAVCRYEIETQPPRKLDSFEKSEVLARLEGGVSDG